jgi:hypothetical protein
MLRSLTTAILLAIAIATPATVAALSLFELVHLFAAFGYLTAAVVKVRAARRGRRSVEVGGGWGGR